MISPLRLSRGFGVMAAIALIGVAVWARAWWMPFLGFTIADADVEPAHDHGPSDRVKLTPQGRANLKLAVKPASLQTYWRTLQVPGLIVDRPGISDRGVTVPVAGVITKIHAFPGDIVKVGDPLFTIRLISEYLQNTQTELFKTAQEIKLNLTQIDRVADLVKTGTVEKGKLVELQNQERRLTTQMLAYRQDLTTRGLTPEQIEAVTQGKFVNEVVVAAPKTSPEAQRLIDDGSAATKAHVDFAYEVQELKVQLGEQVQAGQVLAVLANHHQLYIEGRGFKKEASLLERAAQNGWPVDAEFTEDAPTDWPPFEQKLTIRHLSNVIDPVSRTFAFFLALTNQSRAYEKEGMTFLVWRFRPGQRVRLNVPVEEFKDVFVVPAAGVVREGPEAYVFRANGDSFDRRPVRVLFEDRNNVVIANDGSVSPGVHLAQNAAAALNRVLKSQQSAGGHGHDHEHGCCGH